MTIKKSRLNHSFGVVSKLLYTSPEDVVIDDLPENPRDYLELVKQPAIARVKDSARDEEVAIIGGGAAGLCAAYELMKAGLTPVIFEANDRLGGRISTYSFDKEPEAYAELGAMRFPATQETIFYYLDALKVKEKQSEYLDNGKWPLFPSPKATNTRFEFENRSFFYNKEEDKYYGDFYLIQKVTTIEAKFQRLLDSDLDALNQLDKSFLDGTSGLTEQQYAGKRMALWSKQVDKYQNKSLYEVIKNYRDEEMGSWTDEEINLLGAIGIGTGGIGSLYNTCYLETLRECYNEDDTDQRMIVGGVDQLSNAFWEQPVKIAGADRSKSLKDLHNGVFQRRVTKIKTNDCSGSVELTYLEKGKEKTKTFSAAILTCSVRAIQMGIKINRQAFSQPVWDAIQNFGMVSSQKTFFLTRSAFWHQWNEDHPENAMFTTISDNALQQSYFFDKKDFGVDRQTGAGVVLVSYSWDSDAVKYLALTEEERKELTLNAFEEIYGHEARALLESEIIEMKCVDWDLESGVNGAFRMAMPGQYGMQEALFNQGIGQSGPDNGLYLAGEALAWYGLSGWIEGSLHTGINAALSSIQRINSKAE
ncbi:flavin monoamine oxidase family protein [Endozoicomonas arenosclerae]|uniref:flavin monoamine oxidase family protein n=1 Tax=Endozoicomonas arenosclerae TaxID=1633495 RepID=UPI000B1DA604|nr:NAD(P)/FAD-dependent oxidoreductase [Endozoicomonas arenosclerae]